MVPAMSSLSLLSVILTLLPTLQYTVASPQPSSASQTGFVPTEIVTASSTSSTAKSVSTIPDCTQSCLTNATLSLPCLSTDTECICAHSQQVHDRTLTCLAGSTCSESDITLTANYYDSLCVSLGYPLNASTTDPKASATASLNTGAASGPSITPNAGSTSAQQEPGTATSSLKVSIVTGAAIGGGLLVLLVIATLLIICLRRRQRRRQQAFHNSPNDGRESSQFSTTSTALNTNHSRSNTFTSQSNNDQPKSGKHSRNPTQDTVFTIVSLSDLEVEKEDDHQVRCQDTKGLDSPSSRYTNNTITTTTTTNGGKALPPSPEVRSQMSPALAQFDFGLKGPESIYGNVGLARGSGMGLGPRPGYSSRHRDNAGKDLRLDLGGAASPREWYRHRHCGAGKVDNGGHFV